MHIPDGYLSPQTNAVLGVVSALTAAGAAYKTSKTVQSKYIPLLSIGAAFSFTIMMFNIPIPDGTTAHAVGGTLLAILLGPWAAMIGVSIALVIQALFFGDGGILALGANIFNMGIILPLVGYAVYRLIAGQSAVESKRRLIAAAVAGYLAINVAALVAGVEFGLQPLLFHSANGMPLYSPYGLNVALPAMLFGHVIIAGPVEGLVTFLALSYLQRNNPALLQIMRPSTVHSADHNPSPRYGKLITGILALVVLSPLGLLASGTAWGEWSSEEIQGQLGFVPAGMQKLNTFWDHALLKGYGAPALTQTFWQQSLGYLLSAFVGLLAIGGTAYVLQRLFRKGEVRNGASTLVAKK
ncbi:cobalt transporter CbiM [Desulfosporosinus sp. Sb-LF]|uniref:cobalt transporter CbiM n=1 Tax=Desulfosporosinus sp. Sb-LF TaxID=2560027 RepID=UPI00107F0A96|nr:cobalt transporter CbiM [Desulfosporosinus sp. Sb-LF]TGE32886.1 cobalt transporter CbiM [Desulfosporosinus sp. Sb-LF]